MKSIRIHNHGGPEVLSIDSIPEPKDCPADHLIVEMKAWGLNHLDIWVRNGIPGLNIPLPLILGSDGSGIIEKVGRNMFISNYRVQPGDVIVVPRDMSVYNQVLPTFTSISTIISNLAFGAASINALENN